MERFTQAQPIEAQKATTQEELTAGRKRAITVDWYAIEEPWTKATNPYTPEAEGDCIQTAREALKLIAQ